MCTALLGLLAALSGQIFVASLQTVRSQGNLLHASKGMRMLSVMDDWNECAVSAKAVSDLEGFSPDRYDLLPVWEIGSKAVVFKFARKEGDALKVSYRAVEFSGRSFAVHEWERGGGYSKRVPDWAAFPGGGPDIYRAEYFLEAYFGVPVLNMKLFVSRKAGGELFLEFKTGAENE